MAPKGSKPPHNFDDGINEGYWYEDFELKPRATLKNTREPTTVTLQPDDMAVVMEKDGSMLMYMPNMNEEDPVPFHVQVLSAIMLLSKTDQEFVNYVMDNFYKKIEEREEKDED